ncbi:hypothetical protein Stsp02_53720 [Streptomyces sp. NBRC 14336]|uniref:ankyrin repeat domain-containing protein n=1 Tax=Streptomyces sp. NBRC 14336 TaxID=3030992 RepID=UPI00249FCB30|nr:ankyrin repeat domain-containing protein [Streptomyces sp. NBRC 14336]GLW49711.1 hypothetical protein Stsp02_53720 [Streptomyces sp. NBRC 14336]
MTADTHGWTDVPYPDWEDIEEIRRLLDAGADPERLAYGGARPLHLAALFGSPEVVAELARRVSDVDALENGTTALWEAVVGGRTENARVLVAAGADPEWAGFGGWTPARLSLAGPEPDLFPGAGPALTDAERAVAEEGRRLTSALGSPCIEGYGLACVAGIDAEEAIRRLAVTPADPEFIAELLECSWEFELDEVLPFVGVTDVPGGCVVAQPWGFAPQRPVAMRLLSEGTLAYGLYANPASGNQGCVYRNGTCEGWDLHPGGGPDADEAPEQVLFSYVYTLKAVHYCFAYTGLCPVDARSVTGRPDHWVELPERDYYAS